VCLIDSVSVKAGRVHLELKNEHDTRKHYHAIGTLAHSGNDKLEMDMSI
jgi:hypothetical protein